MGNELGYHGIVKQILIIEAPSILGLKPAGVEKLPEALAAAGLYEKLRVQDVRRVQPLAYSSRRDKKTNVLNPQGIQKYSRRLAEAVEEMTRARKFPLVLGGDCSILIGNMLALKRLGQYGLFFLDGHADFYQPDASPTGEVADMDLAIVSGRGPEILTNLEKQGPYVRDEAIVLFGPRDLEQAVREGSQDVRKTAICVFDLATISQRGVEVCVQEGLRHLREQVVKGFWVHLDVDILHDRWMPAVDYRMPGGLMFKQLRKTLQMLLASGSVVGMDVTIFNPRLDRSGQAAKRLVSLLVSSLSKLPL